MRLGDTVPNIGDQWDWDIAEIMERKTNDFRSYIDDHLCADVGCGDDDCVASSIDLAWDEILEMKRDDAHYEHVVESIHVHGFTVPLTAQVNDAGEVCLGDGHHRLAAAIQLGFTTVPVVMAKHLSFISDDSFLWGYESEHDSEIGVAAQSCPPAPTQLTTRDGRVIEFEPVP